MRATTYLSLFLAAAAGTAGVVTACANGGDDTGYTAGDDGGSGGDATTGGDGSMTMGDGGTQDGDAGVDVFMCTPVGPTSDCTMAMNLGTLTPGQMTNAMGNIATLDGQAFFAVSFTGNGQPTYHPLITLDDGGSEFAFDILSDCNGFVLTCDDGDASGSTTWEQYYVDASDYTRDVFVPIPPAGDDGGVVVRVYRRTGMPLSCNQYSLTVSQ
ncbi:MAG TPA: hypothetical protein VF765_24635 [Polyangiaceae bacterium]